MHLRSLLLASLVAAAPVGPVASAQTAAPAPTVAADRTEEAKGLFNAGRAAFDAGRYADALDYFRRSYAISGRPALLYNIGIALDRMREDQQALEAYEQYLAQAPGAPNRAEVEIRAAAIREALARRQPAPAATPVPTPEEVAAAAPAAPPANVVAAQPAAGDTRRDSDGGGVLTKWWFWTAIGVVVAGGVTATLIAVNSGEDSPTPVEPRSGVLVTTLRSAR